MNSELLVDILCEAARKPEQQSGVVCGATRTSYAEIDLFSDRLAKALVEKGIEPGDRVVTVLASSVEFVIACFAVWKARAIVVPEDSAIRPTNLLHILKETEPAALIVERKVAAQLQGMRDALPYLRAIFVKDRTFALSDLAVWPTGGRPDDVVSITYTSGSTGPPKGVMHTHESWHAGAAFTRDYVGLSPNDKIIIPLPLHHAYAFRQILAYLLAGGTVLIAADIYQALKLMREQRPTALLLVPAACNIIIDHFGSILHEADSFLRYIEIGSASITPGRLQRLQELLPTTSVHLAYGLTEARVGFLEPGSDGLFNRIARLSPGLELQVIDGQGQPVAKGQTGEIVLRGTGLMRGYWRTPPAEQERLRNQGFRTGDIGRVDSNGKVALLGRLDHVLKIGGRKVDPIDVETVLNRHPTVVESVVTGLPDPRGIFELELHAFVVLRSDATTKETELLAHCRQQLEPYKIPVRIHFRTSLPKSAVGKVQRHLLAVEQAAPLSAARAEYHASAD